MSDLIDRQAAIEAVDGLPNCYNGYSDTYDKACIIGLLEELPSAERKGKWIDVERAPRVYRCSVCGYALEAQEWGIRSNYCPHCGARMVRGEEDEVD